MKLTAFISKNKNGAGINQGYITSNAGYSICK